MIRLIIKHHQHKKLMKKSHHLQPIRAILKNYQILQLKLIQIFSNVSSLTMK